MVIANSDLINAAPEPKSNLQCPVFNSDSTADITNLPILYNSIVESNRYVIAIHTYMLLYIGYHVWSYEN